MTLKLMESCKLQDAFSRFLVKSELISQDLHDSFGRILYKLNLLLYPGYPRAGLDRKVPGGVTYLKFPKAFDLAESGPLLSNVAT